MKHFEAENCIKVQALELLETVLDFTLDVSDCIQDKLSKNDLLHQFIVNGCTSSLPNLLTFYTELSYESSTRRVIACLTFIIKYSPQDLALAIITVLFFFSFSYDVCNSPPSHPLFSFHLSHLLFFKNRLKTGQ